MTSHASFIILAYLAGAIILGWTAFAPVLRKRKMLAELGQLQAEQPSSQKVSE